MAKIEMDMSEYEAMKKVERLLEEALVRETTANKQIVELKEEKVKVLEANSKKVTIIHRTETTEHILVRRGFREAITRFSRMLQHGRTGEVFHHHVEDEFERMFEVYFNKNTSYSTSTDSIEHKGLEIIKQEIAKEYNEKQSKEDKDELMQLGIIKKANTELVREAKIDRVIIKERDAVIKDLEKVINNNEVNITHLTEEIKFFESSKIKAVKIEHLLNKERGMFASSKILAKMDKLWKNN